MVDQNKDLSAQPWFGPLSLKLVDRTASLIAQIIVPKYKYELKRINFHNVSFLQIFTFVIFDLFNE